MNSDQVSLVNSKVRTALIQGNTMIIAEGILFLCEGDHLKANLLFDWFSGISNLCDIHNVKQSNLFVDVYLFRMWQLGNIDINQVSEKGFPTFSLTNLGIEKINDLPKNQWAKTLLWNKQKSLA